MSGIENLYVTRPMLPPLADLLPLLEGIWSRRVLTNGGPLHEAFEAQLADELGVSGVSLVSNATLGLILALRQCTPGSQVITSPFSFVATTHAIRWAGLEPVFADIDPQTMTLDPIAAAHAITPDTGGILPVHCYGRPCDVTGLSALAAAHDLRLIYDAAHAFGAQHFGRPLASFGDLSVLSFHATKVMNTFEGGAIICHDLETKRSLDALRNNGIVDEVEVTEIGLNAKMSELSAAVGLVELPYVRCWLEARRQVDQTYRELLASVPGIDCPPLPDGLDSNFAYFPILVSADYPLSRDELYLRLRRRGIYTRRYFFPLISNMAPYKHLPSAAPENLPHANEVAARVLCLPIYPDLSLDDLRRVTDSLAEFG